MSTQALSTQQITITSPARLHLGFFDLNGELGRKFGSLGIALAQPVTQLAMTKNDQLKVDGLECKRVEYIVKKLTEVVGCSPKNNVHVRMQQVIPAHAGLGSGTQLALTVGMAYSQLYSLDLTPSQIAQYTARGARSGIGIGTYLHGGVVIDGGRGLDTVVPPMIARADFPEEWRIILILEDCHQGVHGEEEVAAFKNLAPVPAQVSEKICRHVLMQALPALAEHNIVDFGRAVAELQHATGDYFAPAQGGGRYASKNVTQVLTWLENQGVYCLGQSSWGPTGFAIVENETLANELLLRLNQQFANQPLLSFKLTKGCNHGAKVELSHAVSQ
jgi:beta-RFAP synthase